MQNTVIPVTSPAVSAYTPTVVDNSTAQTELFGNVLARQLADSVQLGETNTSDTGLPITAATDNILTLTVSNEQPIELQVPTPDSVSALPSDMLAALLPPNIATQISMSRTQPTQPEADSHNRAQSITTSKVSLGYDAPAIAKASLEYDTPATALEILNTGHSSKSMTLLEDSKLTPESSTQLNAPPSNATALVALQAQVLSAANLHSPISLSIDMPVTNNAWADDFSQKITWVATQHGQSAELHLNPPQLGPLDVLIKVNGDQATALFTSPHAVVRDAIEQALPKLREMLADNGIMLGNATVSDQSPREQQTKQTDQQQKREGWQAKMDQAIVIGGTQVRSGRHHQGLVDTFA
ncbi:flagellar hook-length control protein FliK [Candidatus Nitrotoga sp. 1052]|uniref:flagellar hook-length control protein FliK n=1 Tax=Candidatus Nitrotoga sp. 1052 TaxID=2886964 RepID=UPI001EF4A48F|nr:flagellar hook-length control protein FliK [Candidatus Nitrotoga sp. 1052]CAH1073824.1 Flagellar hook-length control protein fliK [Candidatus Nitrotoga sp. 1052]